MDDAEFRAGALSTAFLDEFFARRQAHEPALEAEAVAALAAVLDSTEAHHSAVHHANLAMVADRPGVAAAVKYEIVIDGKAAALSVSGERFEYQREGGAPVEREYSAAPAGDGIWSILIDGRSYAVAILGAGEVSVNGRVFRVDVFDPRELRGRRSAADSSGPQAIAAPMPGRVIRVLVESRPGSGGRRRTDCRRGHENAK